MPPKHEHVVCLSLVFLRTRDLHILQFFGNAPKPLCPGVHGSKQDHCMPHGDLKERFPRYVLCLCALSTRIQKTVFVATRLSLLHHSSGFLLSKITLQDLMDIKNDLIYL